MFCIFIILPMPHRSDCKYLSAFLCLLSWEPDYPTSGVRTGVPKRNIKAKGRTCRGQICVSVLNTENRELHWYLYLII